MARKKVGTAQLSASAQKIAELVETRSGGNQREFARLVGCAQPVVSRILNGKQEPGRDLLERIAKLENVDRDELIATLETQGEIDRASRTQVPIASTLLDGHPASRQELLTINTVAVSPTVFRASLYAIPARACEPAFSNPSERMRADDLIVIESSVERLRSNLQALNGKLCVVFSEGRSGNTITLRRVWISFDDSSNDWVIQTCPDSKLKSYLDKKIDGKRLRSIQLDPPEDKPAEKQFAEEAVDIDNIVGIAIELIRNL